ncbi:MAG: hypothetical protein ABH872_00590 [Candidatus Omnitrophota bacterium]
MKNKLKKGIKTQSILEYIAVLTAVVIAIVAGTVGLRQGVDTGLSQIQDEATNNIMKQTEPPENIASQDFYEPPGNLNDPKWNDQTDTYGGAEYNQGEYYFHQGESDMGYVKEVEKSLPAVISGSLPETEIK